MFHCQAEKILFKRSLLINDTLSFYYPLRTLLLGLYNPTVLKMKFIVPQDQKLNKYEFRLLNRYFKNCFDKKINKHKQKRALEWFAKIFF